jgi:hypothetical protein
VEPNRRPLFESSVGRTDCSPNRTAAVPVVVVVGGGGGGEAVVVVVAFVVVGGGGGGAEPPPAEVRIAPEVGPSVRR